MKKAMLFAAALGLLSVPAFAQQSPTGQSAGGPARVGSPGQIGGGVPGSRPGVVGQRRKMMMMKKHRRSMMHRRARRM